MLLILAFAILAAAAYFVGEVATQPGRDRRHSLRRATEYGRVHVRGEQRARFRERVVVPMMRRFAKLALRMNPRVTVEMISARLLAVSVEAGLGFDGAITKLTEHMEGALTDELALTLNEMRIGESRHDALKKLAERAAAPEVANFSRAIIQADQLGISLGRILRVQATDTRLRRQAAAEERAMKAPIKMLFPTVAFIFPAMFLVILGPAFLNLSKLF